MNPAALVPRHLQGPVMRTLRHFPVTGIIGARQVGKSTLAQSLRAEGWSATYLTLDERAVLTAALEDPEGFIVGNPPPLILDEIQRAPDLLLAIKRTVDRDRRPGSYLLTGSVHLLSLKQVSETLAGRVVYHELLPLSWSELEGRQSPAALIDGLFAAGDAQEFITRWGEVGRQQPPSREELAARILAGGYPDASLATDPWVRSQWFEGYRQTYLTRDVRDLAELEHMPAFDRLLVLTALRTGQILNQADLSRDLGIPYSTARRYLSLLEQTYQVWFLRPFYTNPGLRLVKSAKIYHMDTGLAAHLAALDDWTTVERQGRAGQLFETWVAGELRKALPLCGRATGLWFWRTHQGREVDFVLERGAEVVGIEVKWGTEVDRTGLRGLAALKNAVGERFRLGVVVHTGHSLVALSDDIVAMPVHVLLGGIP